MKKTLLSYWWRVWKYGLAFLLALTLALMPLTVLSDEAGDPWQLYRQGQISQAEEGFQRQLRENPRNWDALTGLGYVAYQQGNLTLAQQRFDRALSVVPQSVDALVGLGLVFLERQEPEQALTYFERAASYTTNNAWIQPYIQQAKELANRLTPQRPSQTQIVAKTTHDYLSIPTATGFKPLFVKGVNLGVALPGRFPAEFPTEEKTYSEWLELISAMGANTIRTYTILPPEFYQALKAHNQKFAANRKIWLIQGVWTELPSEVLKEKVDDYSHPEFEQQFVAEMQRVVNLIHGRANLRERPGHASGNYTADVSDSTLSYLIGREWEPFSVVDYNKIHPDRTQYRGRFIQVKRGHAMEVWLAKMMDTMLAYEIDRYNQQRPISFTNWPTLDPLFHITEATNTEEMRLRRELGLQIPSGSPQAEIKEYSNDEVGIDINEIQVTNAFTAGIYATYHAYPYYPDFMAYDPGYLKARSPFGRSNYYGYLQALKRHHQNTPILIAEFGVPTSRENAHFQPQGWHHGGHSEQAQAQIDARLFQEIFSTKMAGGVLFALMDEWFKKNWMFIDYELPPERNPLWYNALDPEQNFGIIAMHPGKSQMVMLDGKSQEWQQISPFYRAERPENPLQLFAVTSDEGYIYLRIKAKKINWQQQQIWVAIDTYASDRGSFKLPGLSLQAQNGSEFLVQLTGDKTSRLLVHEPYSLFRHRFATELVSTAQKPGEFVTIEAEPNRMRIGRDRKVYSAIRTSRSNLKRGSTNRQAADFNSLSDWNYNTQTGEIEVRIPWGLLNVTDPSSHQVYHRDGQVMTSTTEGFSFNVIALKPANRVQQSPQVLATFPQLINANRLDAPKTYRWDGWEQPTYHSYLKKVYQTLQNLLPRLELKS
ncbi:MAG: tetratricopeptide repeat protein [Cyanosarcina radialis HA8281-LM2]|nr:tetratricopeptide repeat protein [Cyanosarcina radialis HA8281-LM2]